MHAVEVSLFAGKPYSSILTQSKKERPFSIIKIGLNRERDELYDNINRRVEQMIADGLEAEARSVYHIRHLNSLNTVGFKEMFAYFDGDITFDEAVEQIKRNTRRYAKKQLTWFGKDPEIQWYTPETFPSF
ncbi:MAG: tRNA (adenosine(37)-N6)-dimethylallyltransferase MiaA, partial [Paludibacteraceae bacterium]|nr:tRNA (adenosine(37)-N6)-dimethylallyltransferase MiaA [Paludibacteraceae bacterium]